MTTGGLIAAFIVLFAIIVVLLAMVCFMVRVYREGKRCEYSTGRKYSGRSVW